MDAYLRYIGLGSYLPDVPARDLKKEEAEYFGIGRLVDSHLYEVIHKENNDNIVDKKSKKEGK